MLPHRQRIDGSTVEDEEERWSKPTCSSRPRSVPVADQLTGRHRVIIVDLLGFGSSPVPTAFEDMWVNAQAKALAKALNELTIDRVAVVGHDMGGPVALTLFRLYPTRVTHLGLLSTNTFGDTPVDFPLSLVRVPAVGRLVERALFSRPSLNAVGRAASKTSRARPAQNTRSEAKTIRTIFGNVLRELPDLYDPIEDTLPTVNVPTLVIWGDRDMFFSVQQGSTLPLPYQAPTSLFSKVAVTSHRSNARTPWQRHFST